MREFAYSVDPDTAREVVASLESVESSLTDVVTDLRWRMTHLHESWTGAAAAAHLEAHRDWVASFHEMHTALVTMRSVVDTAAAAYGSAASTGVQNWSAVR